MRQTRKQTQNETATEVQNTFEVVRIYKFETDRPLKAFADVSINNSLLIKGLRVLSNKEGGLYVSMPSEKATDGKFYETVRVLTAETRQELQEVVLAAYNS